MVPGWLGFDKGITDGALNIPLSTGAPARTIFRQTSWGQGGRNADLGSPFEARNLLFRVPPDATALAAWTADLTEVASQRRMMNQPIHIRNLAGTAQEPAILREPIWFESNFALQMVAKKIAGAAVDVRMFLGGVNYYPWDQVENDPSGSAQIRENILSWRERRKYIIPYWLTTDTPNQPVALTGNGSASAIGKIGDDAQFEAYSLCVVSTGAFTMTIQEVRSKQYLMNGPISSQAAWGTARLPTFFPVPYLIPRGAKLQFNFVDLSGSTNNIYVTLAGRSIYAEIRDAQELSRQYPAIITGSEQAPQSYPRPIVLGERI